MPTPPESWENTLPPFSLRYPKPEAPAANLPAMFLHTAQDVSEVMSDTYDAATAATTAANEAVALMADAVDATDATIATAIDGPSTATRAVLEADFAALPAFTTLDTFTQDNVSKSYATAAALPSTGNRIGRLATAADTGLLYQCVALPNTWRIVNPQRIRALVTPTRVSFTALGVCDLAVVEDVFGMVNTSTDEITVPVTGTYLVLFNLVQSGTSNCLGAIFVNGTQVVTVGATGATGAPSTPSGSAMLLLNAGDKVTIRCSAGTTTTFGSGSTASLALIAGTA